MFLFSVKTQIRVMYRQTEFKVAFLITLLYACLSFVYALNITAGQELYSIKDASQYLCFGSYFSLWHYFQSIYPFLVVIPCATSYIDDKRNHLLPLYFARTSRRIYYSSKLAACFLGTAAVIFLPFLFNMLLCNLFLPHNNNTWLGEYQMLNFQGYVLGTNLLYETPHRELAFARLFLNNRLLYSFIYLAAISLFSGLLGTVILGLSFILNQSKILLFIPLFAAQHISQTFDTKALNHAISNGDTYTNLRVLEYFIPGFSKGQSPIFLMIVLGFLALFVLISFLFAQREDIRSLQ